MIQPRWWVDQVACLLAGQASAGNWNAFRLGEDNEGVFRFVDYEIVGILEARIAAGKPVKMRLARNPVSLSCPIAAKLPSN